jgi:hypothetical protein
MKRSSHPERSVPPPAAKETLSPTSTGWGVFRVGFVGGFDWADRQAICSKEPFGD